jgi:hypothetical protein
MKKEYLPMALGFWGVAVPLVLFGFLFCHTTAERIAVFLAAAVFFFVGYFISKAKQ